MLDCSIAVAMVAVASLFWMLEVAWPEADSHHLVCSLESLQGARSRWRIALSGLVANFDYEDRREIEQTQPRDYRGPDMGQEQNLGHEDPH